MIEADWKQAYPNSASIEADLPGIKFKGPGWYFTDKDAILILPYKGPGGGMEDNALVLEAGDELLVHCWNNVENDPRDVLRNIYDLPNHTLESKPKDPCPLPAP